MSFRHYRRLPPVRERLLCMFGYSVLFVSYTYISVYSFVLLYALCARIVVAGRLWVMLGTEKEIIKHMYLYR